MERHFQVVHLLEQPAGPYDPFGQEQVGVGRRKVMRRLVAVLELEEAGASSQEVEAETFLVQEDALGQEAQELRNPGLVPAAAAESHNLLQVEGLYQVNQRHTKNNEIIALFAYGSPQILHFS